MIKIHKNNPWSSLRQVVLGNYYWPEYFSNIKDHNVREPLMRVADEIHRDLEIFERVLKTLGCEVFRPELISVDQFQHTFETKGYLPEAPLHVRNDQFVLGDHIYGINPYPSMVEMTKTVGMIDITDRVNQVFNSSLDRARDSQDYTGRWYSQEKYQSLRGADWPDFHDYVRGKRSGIASIDHEINEFRSELTYEDKEFVALQCPNIIPMPDRLIIDTNEYVDYTGLLHDLAGDIEIEKINTKAAHTDGCFTILGNKTIIGIDPLIDYAKHFPGYHVISVPASCYGDIIREKNLSGSTPSWWLPDVHNSALAAFVDRYMQKYTGSVHETLFDVNVLCVNEQTVCISNNNQNLIRQLKSRGIDAVVIPWRHRFFVDGGLHCITLDLYRDPI